jgi:hypothetical protein
MRLPRHRIPRALLLRRLLALGLLGIPLALSAGCDGKDGSADPGPTGTTDGTAEQEAIVDQALGAIEFVNGFISDIDAYRQGDFSGLSQDLGLPVGGTLRAGEEPVWIAEEGAWILEAAATETQDGATLTYDVYFRLQFLSGTGLPQRDPDATTASFSIDVDMDLAMHAEEDGEVFDLGFDVLMAMGLTGLPDGPYSLTGGGDLGLSMLWTGVGEEDLDVAAAMAWVADLDLAGPDACPVGAVEVSVEGVEAIAEYDGDDTYSWRVLENGIPTDTGTGLVECGGVS